MVVLTANSSTFSFFELSGVDSVATSPKHDSIIVSIAASPSGNYLACGCVSGALYVWERGNGGAFTLVGENHRMLHSDAVSLACFSADSSLVISCGIDGSYFVYKVKDAGFLNPDTKVMKLTENPPNDHQFTTFANEQECWIDEKKVKAKISCASIKKMNWLLYTPHCRRSSGKSIRISWPKIMSVRISRRWTCQSSLLT